MIAINGYETMTTFWAECSSADTFGVKAVKEIGRAHV